MDQNLLDWINAASGVATFGTLVFVLIKEFRTRKQVQDLTIVATELAEQNKLMKHQFKAQFKPIWKAILKNRSMNDIVVTVKNEGQLALIKNVYGYDGKLKLNEVNLFEVPKDGSFEISFSGANFSGDLGEFDLRFSILYSDCFANYYDTVFVNENKYNWVPQTVDVVSPKNRAVTTAL